MCRLRFFRKIRLFPLRMQSCCVLKSAEFGFCTSHPVTVQAFAAEQPSPFPDRGCLNLRRRRSHSLVRGGVFGCTGMASVEHLVVLSVVAAVVEVCPLSRLLCWVAMVSHF